MSITLQKQDLKDKIKEVAGASEMYSVVNRQCCIGDYYINVVKASGKIQIRIFVNPYLENEMKEEDLYPGVAVFEVDENKYTSLYPVVDTFKP